MVAKARFTVLFSCLLNLQGGYLLVPMWQDQQSPETVRLSALCPYPTRESGRPKPRHTHLQVFTEACSMQSTALSGRGHFF